MEVGNEMEIFITLMIYNTRQQREEGKPLLVVYYLISILTPPLTTVSNIFIRQGTNPLMFRGTVYNTFLTCLAIFYITIPTSMYIHVCYLYPDIPVQIYPPPHAYRDSYDVTIIIIGNGHGNASSNPG